MVNFMPGVFLSQFKKNMQKTMVWPALSWKKVWGELCEAIHDEIIKKRICKRFDGDCVFGYILRTADP